MAEKLEDGDLWLPEEFLGEGFILEERRAAALMQEIEKRNGFILEERRAAASMPEIEKRNGLVRENPSLSSNNIMMETESDEEDYVAGLTRQMVHSFLVEDNTSSFWDSRVLATSPQSTLCDAGIWASSTGSQNVCSKSSPPLSAFLEQRKEDAMDLFYAAAGEVLRKKQNEQRAYERYQRKNPLVDAKSSAITGSHNNHVLERQRIQAAQFYRLKQQQLVKQQLSSPWSRQNRAAASISNRPHGLASSAWSSLQQQQPSSGMRALFLNGSGARRESAGTGVFLPRRAGSPTDKKPACSTVHLPARVVQALNLTLEDAGIQPRFPVQTSRDHETASVRFIPGHIEPKRNLHKPPPASISSHEIRLPKEWTY